MALTIKDTYHLLRELSEYGMAIYYLIEKSEQGTISHKTITYNEIENVIYKKNMEQISLIFPKIISKISLDDLEQAEIKYKHEYTKRKCLKDFLKRKKDKFSHLQDIQDIALTEELASQIVLDDTYHEVLNLKYTDKILTHLEKHPKDDFFSTKDTLSCYRQSLEQLKTENEEKISSNINNYYISTITE